MGYSGTPGIWPRIGCAGQSSCSPGRRAAQTAAAGRRRPSDPGRDPSVVLRPDGVLSWERGGFPDGGGVQSA